MAEDATDQNQETMSPRHRRGYRDGKEGLSPTDATEEYLGGYLQGRKEYLEMPEYLRPDPPAY